jgi:hypothetical protein
MDRHSQGEFTRPWPPTRLTAMLVLDIAIRRRNARQVSQKKRFYEEKRSREKGERKNFHVVSIKSEVKVQLFTEIENFI